MTASMNWDDMNFKASDVVKLIVGLITVIWVAANINNKIETIADNQSIMRDTQVEFIKDYKINQKAIETQINSLSIEVKMQGFRLDALEKDRESKK